MCPRLYEGNTDHVVDGVVDRFDNLFLPLVVDPSVTPGSVEDVIHIDSPVEEIGPDPLDKHRVARLTGQVDDDWFARCSNISHYSHFLGGFSLVFTCISSDPNLVFFVRLCEGKR